MLQLQHFRSVQHLRASIPLPLKKLNQTKPLLKINLECHRHFHSKNEIKLSSHIQTDVFHFERRLGLFLKQLERISQKCGTFIEDDHEICFKDWMPRCVEHIKTRHSDSRTMSYPLFSKTIAFKSNCRHDGLLASCFCASVSHRNVHTVSLSKTFLISQASPSITVISKRFKQKKKGRGKEREEETSDDSDDEADEDDEGDDLAQLYDAPREYKKMKVHIKSLRADAIISSGLNIARNKVDEMFYNSKLHVNGEKLLKKGKQLSVGDYVDMVTSVSEGVMKVKRVQLVKVSPDRTKSDKHVAWVRTWKAGFEIDKPDKFIPQNSEQ